MPPADDVENSADEPEANRRARRGVREWVRSAGKSTGRGLRKVTPYGTYAFLTAAAVAPVAGAALGGTDAFATALDQLGGMGGNYLANVLADTADRMRRQGIEPTGDQWRDAVAEELRARLEDSGEETLRLREEVGQVLRAVDGVGAALTESAEHAHDLHQELVGAIAVLGNDFDEFRWMLTDLKQALAESTRTLGDVQRELLLARTEQREQSDVTHRFLVAVTKVRQWLKPEHRAPAPPADGPCPYPGLTSFQAGDAEWFHGRENAVAEVLARLDRPGPLVIVGASGAGKSSLLHAGLLPALADGALPAAGSAAWPRLVLSPGANPLGELAARVAALAGVNAVAAARDLRAAPAEFGALARQAALATGESARLVLVVDQFEQVFTPYVDAAERLAFATALANAGPALVVLAVRADFYEQCTRLEPLAAALPDQFVLGPMTPDELHRVVTEPASKAGLVVEAGLAERLVADLGVREGADYDPGALPMLAHALHETWRNRAGHTLTAEGYARTGGIEHAVSGTADRIVGALGDTEREALRRTLLRMVTVVDGGGAVRRHVRRDEADLTVLTPLIEARLVTADQSGAQISHEALLTAWPRLRAWVDEDRHGLLVRQQLDEAVRYWTSNNRDDGALYRGLRLASAQEWAGPRTDLSDAEREFLRASERAQQRSARRLRGLVAALAVLLVAALTAGVLALVARDEAERDRLNALSRQYAAESLRNADAAPGESMRKALSAWQTAHTTEARSALLTASTLTYPATFDSGLGTAHAADISPRGEYAAVGGPDGKIVVWDLRANQPLPAEFSGHTEAVDDVEFSPDGSLLATTSAEAFGLRIWEVPSGRLVRTLPGVFRLAWRPDGGELAAVGLSLDFPVVGWDPSTGQEVRRLPGDRSLVHDLAFGAGDRLAVARAGGVVELWRTGDSTLVTRVEAHSAEGGMRVAFAPGVLATSSQRDTEIRLWDSETGAPQDPLRLGGEFGPGAMAFSPDGMRLFAGVGAEVQRWDVSTRQRAGNYAWDRDPVADLVVSADGRTVAAAAVTGKVTRWQRATSWYTRPSGPVIGIAFAPDGRTVAASDGTGAVHLWDPATGEQRDQFTSDAGLVSVLRYTPDGTRVEAVQNGVVRVTPPGGGAPRTVALPGRELRGDLVVSPDGALIAAASRGADDFRVHLFDTATLTERKVLELGAFSAYSMVFSPDGANLLAATSDTTTGGVLRSWRTTDFGEAWSTPLGPEFVTGLAISPDGRTLATGDGEQLRLRAAADGRVLREVGAPHPSAIRDLVFSPDSLVLASGTIADATVRLWNVADGGLLAVADGLTGPPNDLAFSPDGTVLAAAGTDTDVVLWRIEPEAAVAEICRNLTDGGATGLTDLGCR
ncbi:WD40 repeat domain-containing protein [Amycolatopsis sp. 195334CR]|uniref:nSTAND1 domain-containing NTPase n=1 Tax=Amycolatopsis sp. 195334CR TaxID=2814588 RepID=UPI001A8C072F|nr:WD40 repeat domain-containing protein [Amycolatopsis sp. 195334CR]MBN6040235.1 hypothetical protein [Amycolatopsis sp. 195334CR]